MLGALFWMGNSSAHPLRQRSLQISSNIVWINPIESDADELKVGRAGGVRLCRFCRRNLREDAGSIIDHITSGICFNTQSATSCTCRPLGAALLTGVELSGVSLSMLKLLGSAQYHSCRLEHHCIVYSMRARTAWRSRYPAPRSNLESMRRLGSVTHVPSERKTYEDDGLLACGQGVGAHKLPWGGSFFSVLRAGETQKSMLTKSHRSKRQSGKVCVGGNNAHTGMILIVVWK